MSYRANPALDLQILHHRDRVTSGAKGTTAKTLPCDRTRDEGDFRRFAAQRE